MVKSSIYLAAMLSVGACAPQQYAAPHGPASLQHVPPSYYTPTEQLIYQKRYEQRPRQGRPGYDTVIVEEYITRPPNQAGPAQRIPLSGPPASVERKEQIDQRIQVLQGDVQQLIDRTNERVK